MDRPDFSKIKLSRTALENGKQEGEVWKSPENIAIKPVFYPEDIEGMEHLSYVAGIPPFLRGPYSSMYTVRPWTIRQYSGFSTAEESNAF
ncbi:MAG: methylmalonyl-CoA mutase, partial [Phaeodactylibacter sp.]|nr:methylmalonyl-CoA mutase [Phaeodactylibacter sp.]